MLRIVKIICALLVSIIVQAGIVQAGIVQAGAPAASPESGQPSQPSQHSQHSQHGQHVSTGDGQFNPYVAADHRGGFYVLHVERVDKVSNIFIRHTRDGISFSAPVRVNDVPGQAAVRNENPPKMLVGPQGDLYVSWGDEREKWKGNIHFSRSTDGGKSFSPALTINSDGALPPVGHAFQSMAIDGAGRIFIAWIDERRKTKEDRGAEIWMAVSADRGRTFSADRQIISDVCECCRTILQTDAAGNIYVAYRTVPRAGKMLRDIVVARSSDGGATFTPTVVSQDGWEINGCPVVGPSMTIDRSGTITMAWFVGGGSRPGLYYAVSRDQARSFSPRQLFTAEQRLAKHAHAVSLTDGRTLYAWDDATENGQTATFWGVVGPERVRRDAAAGPGPKVLGSETGVSYPIIAVSGRKALVVGLQPGKTAIFTRSFGLPK